MIIIQVREHYLIPKTGMVKMERREGNWKIFWPWSQKNLVTDQKWKVTEERGVSNISWASVLNNWIEIDGGLTKLGQWILVKLRKEPEFSTFWNWAIFETSKRRCLVGIWLHLVRVKQGWRFLLHEITLEITNKEKKHRTKLNEILQWVGWIQRIEIVV